MTFKGIEQVQEQVRQQSVKNKEEDDVYCIKKGTYDLLSKLKSKLISQVRKLCCVGVNNFSVAGDTGDSGGDHIKREDERGCRWNTIQRWVI